MNDDFRKSITRRAAIRTIGGVSAGALAAQAAAFRAQAMPRSPTGEPGPPHSTALSSPIIPKDPVPVDAPVNRAAWSPNLHAKAESFFVLDAVAHCYNHSEINKRDRSAASKTLDVSAAYHDWSTPARFRLTPEQYNRDWQPDETMDVMFLESPTDMILMQSVPIYGSYWDGLVSNEKGAYLKDKYPDRVLWYGAIDAFDSFENVRAKIDQLTAQGADGLKLYPTAINHVTKKTTSFFMDDEKVAFPIFEYARSKGVRNIGCHKLVGYTPNVPALGINDFYKAAAQFPDITFHIVHGGWMLIEETAELMRARPNVTAMLEGPMIWPHYDRAAYDHMWSVLMKKVDVDRLIYASTSPNQHPYWIINDFVDYEPPKGAGFRMTHEDKAKILGLNLARYQGIDVKRREAKLRNDKFWRARSQKGYREPYIVQRTEPTVRA